MKRERRVNEGLGLRFGCEEIYNHINGFPGSSTLCTPPYKYYSVNSTPSSAVAVGVGSDCGGGEGLNYIEHPVSKYDTLAGVAIKYGVEVADIKKLNGLVTDLQMFALKTIQIPLPGRHPPSPIVSNGLDTQGPNGSDRTPSSLRDSNLFDSFQSLKLKSTPQGKVSSAMSSLRGYYGLKTQVEESASEGYRKEGSHYLEDGQFSKPSTNPPLTLRRKCKSVAYGLQNGDLAMHNSYQEDKDTDSDNWVKKLLLRRCQKSEADLNSRTPEMLLKKDNCGVGGFSAITGKGLALRPKSASRIPSGADHEAGLINPIPVGLGDSFVSESLNVVRKSSSTSSLQESDCSTLASLWSTSFLKPDLQAFSTTGITKPIFDGLPKPASGRKNKAALD